MKMRYAAPANFTAMNAYCDVASSAESPSAARNVWITLPAVMPSAAAIPALRPPARLRPRMKNVSWPGVRMRTMAVAMNSQ